MKIEIELGLMADPLPKQLRGILPSMEANRLQRLSESINDLVVRGILTDSETAKARRRLMVHIKSIIATREIALERLVN